MGADDLAVERVVEPELGPGLPHRGVEQAPGLELLDRLQWHQALQEGEVHRIAERHQLERLELELVQADQPLLDEVAQARRVGQRAVEAPQAELRHQGPGLQGALDELPEEQHVAGAGLHQGLEGGPVDRPADGQRGQGPEVALGERAHLDAERLLLLPHADHGVGVALAGAHGEDQEGAAPLHQLGEEHRRGVVELLGVVDHQHQPAVPPAVVDRLGGGPEQVAAEVGGHAEVGEERGEGGQRQPGAALGGPDRRPGASPARPPAPGPGTPAWSSRSRRRPPGPRRRTRGRRRPRPGRGTRRRARPGARPSRSSRPLPRP